MLAGNMEHAARPLGIDRLVLSNYRSFERFELDLHPRLTVLVAPNGGGKTAVLDAISVAVGPFLSAFDEARGAGFTREDAHLVPTGGLEMEPRYPVTVECAGPVDGSPATWRRSLQGAKGKTTIAEARALKAFGQELQHDVREGKDVSLPLLAYYGTGRLWKHGRLGKVRKRVSSPLSSSRTMGYRGCLDPYSSFREFTLWFRQLSLAELQQKTWDAVQKQDDRLEVLANMLAWTREAIDHVLRPSGWGKVFYDLANETISAMHEQHGRLPVNRLSDGVRNLLGLVADIAFRCCKLNPTRGPRETGGMVLVDEVGMHLHPAWQQRVLLALLEAFPRLQFVVTTHSPHVVSTVPRESVRILGDEKGVVPSRQTAGLDSAAVLAEVFGVSPEPEIDVVKKLRRYRALAEQGYTDTEEARILRTELEEALGPDDPRLTAIDTLLALRRRLGTGS